MTEACIIRKTCGDPLCVWHTEVLDKKMRITCVGCSASCYTAEGDRELLKKFRDQHILERHEEIQSNRFNL